MGSSLGIRATPTFIIGIRRGDSINGTTIVGLHDYGTFRSVVEAQLNLSAISSVRPAPSTARGQAPLKPALINNLTIADLMRIMRMGWQ
jgi:hypothetical protein